MAGILTLGGKHAPLEQTYQFLCLEHPEMAVPKLLESGSKVPGWGGSFQQDGHDPIWQDVNSLLRETQLLLIRKLDAVTTVLHRMGKKIYPNPSAYTVTVTLALGLPSKMAIYFFIDARLDAWAQIAMQKL